jgi:hypothetical protein
MLERLNEEIKRLIHVVLSSRKRPAVVRALCVETNEKRREPRLWITLMRYPQWRNSAAPWWHRWSRLAVPGCRTGSPESPKHQGWRTSHGAFCRTGRVIGGNEHLHRRQRGKDCRRETDCQSCPTSLSIHLHALEVSYHLLQFLRHKVCVR